MKLYREGNNEIRIQLTREDLESYSMTADELDYDSPQGKRVIWELFDKARQETGFDTEGEKIYIQLYPTNRGGCDLFVTKLEKHTCFCFSDFDTLYTALSQNNLPIGSDLWREEKKGIFYAIVPEEAVPPLFFEFGEKIKAPSRIFLKSHCRKMHWEQRKL